MWGTWVHFPTVMSKPILSHFQAKEILRGMQEKKDRVVVSLDLGVTSTPLLVDARGVTFPDGHKITFKQLKKIMKNPQKCYFFEDGELIPINYYSETTGWMRTLYPTKTVPTTLVSGYLMHRVKNTDPLADTKEKIKALGSLHSGGRYLDTSFGIGYTAIELGKFGKVTTVDIDPGAMEIAKLNPWSSPLFSNPNIEIVVGDIREVVDTFSEGEFSHILHDPPSFQLADELYSLEFYKKLFRVLKSDGLLFHYVGDPNSKLGSTVTRGVIERLKTAGFGKIEHKKEAFGVLAAKW